MNKAAEIRSLTEAQIDERLLALHQEAFNLRFQRAIAQLDNTARIRTVRKEIARIHTIVGERKRNQSSAGKEN
ncbi:MAG: 50S ribosomal protein L29 [Magnetococcales bacterium]|nr:50S ribosomal protein L29 [Magnetococcales bacterium]